MTTKNGMLLWLGIDGGADGDETDDALPIGKALRVLRVSVGITQTELAKRGGRDGPDFRTISHWETGRKHPSLRLLIQYLKALDFDLHDLQAALDQLAKRPDRLTRRLTAMERRLGALERWRLEETAALMEGSTECESRETLPETSTAS